MLRRCLEACLDVLAPPRCPGCDYVQPAGGFCGGCLPLLDPAPPVAGPDQAALAFHGPAADAVHRLKYRDRCDLAVPLVETLLEFLPMQRGGCVRIVPVPLHPTRLRQRGYNQSGLLAAALGASLHWPVDYRLLRRVRDTMAQVGLSREQRAHNLRGAFEACPAAQGQHFVLIDDVRTSGATLAAARHALRKAGACQVDAVVLAQADEDGTTAR